MNWQDDPNVSATVEAKRRADTILAAQGLALQGDFSLANQLKAINYGADASFTPEALAKEQYRRATTPGNSLNLFKDMVVPGALLFGGGYLGAEALAGLGASGGAAGAVGDVALAGGGGTDAMVGGATAGIGGATEALGGGLTTGATTGAIGGDALGTGLTQGATGATGLSGAATSGALAPGYFAAESAYPIIGGTTAAAAGGLAGGAAGGSAASGLLGGLTAADLLRGVPGVLGALAAKNQTDQLTGLAHEYMGLGAPSRARYEGSYAPGFTMNNDPGYLDALNQSAKATLHGLSITGNPADSPNAWAKSLQDLYEKSAYPALQNYRTTNAGAGGLAALTSAAPTTSTAAINSNANVANGLGVAAADIFTPRQSLADILKGLR